MITQRDLPRVLIVDDSAVARAVLARMLNEGGRFAVAGAVANAEAALAFLDSDRVDAIVLDLEMPGLDGYAALPALLAASAGAQVLVVSSACASSAAATLRALECGAADTLVKPGIGNFGGTFARTLEERLLRLLGEPVANDPAPRKPAPGDDFDIVAIGASTGGIHALSLLLRELGPTRTQPILITQHLPAAFSPYFAAQVAALASRPCDVAEDRMRIRPGRIVVAPGDAHMTVVPLSDGAAIRLSSRPADSGCLPSVDPMLSSVGAVYGARALAVILSGIGRDGATGAAAIARAGGAIVAQDQPSSVVWGMPGTIVRRGLADAVLDPAAIGALIASGRRPA